jgi:hypothetical protein
MTNAEHLIENAVCCLERNEEFEEFASRKHNIEMAEMQHIDLRDVWGMAIHVVYTLKPHWLWQKEDEMVAAYGYKLED